MAQSLANLHIDTNTINHNAEEEAENNQPPDAGPQQKPMKKKVPEDVITSMLGETVFLQQRSTRLMRQYVETMLYRDKVRFFFLLSCCLVILLSYYLIILLSYYLIILLSYYLIILLSCYLVVLLSCCC